jgi:hypothetical protein
MARWSFAAFALALILSCGRSELDPDESGGAGRHGRGGAASSGGATSSGGRTGAGGSAPIAGTAGVASGGVAGSPVAGAGGGGGFFSCDLCEQLSPAPCQRHTCDIVNETCPLVNDDGVACQVACQDDGVCSGGVCVGAPRDCSALDSVCHVGQCDGALDACVATESPPQTACDDQDPCTQSDACLAGDCSGTPITSCTGGDQCCPAGCDFDDDDDCPAEEIVLEALHRGWWSDVFLHDEDNDNTFTGWFAGGRYNSYFVFDLAGVTQTIASARLRLEVEEYFSVESETLSFWDVDTDPLTLEASGAANEQILADLEGGHSYASLVVDPEQQFVDVELDLQAVSDLNAAAGGLFAVGVHVDTLVFGDTEGIRFSYLDEQRTHQLVLDLD